MNDHHYAVCSLQFMRQDEELSPQSLQFINIPMKTSSSDERRHGRKRRRYLYRSSNNSSRFLLLAICYTTTLYFWNIHAFSLPIMQRRTLKFRSMSTPPSQKNILFMSSIAEKPTESNLSHQADNNTTESRLSDFQRRMKGLMKRNGVAQRKESEKPSNLKTVHTLLDYKDQLEKNSDKIVVVRFFATWCKVSCHTKV